MSLLVFTHIYGYSYVYHAVSLLVFTHNMVILVYIMLCLCLFSHITWLFLCYIHGYSCVIYMVILVREKIEDTKGVNRSCKLKKVIQYNCQNKKIKRTNNDQQNKHYPETKSNPAKNWTLNSTSCYGMVSSSWVHY